MSVTGRSSSCFVPSSTRLLGQVCFSLRPWGYGQASTRIPAPWIPEIKGLHVPRVFPTIGISASANIDVYLCVERCSSLPILRRKLIGMKVLPFGPKSCIFLRRESAQLPLVGWDESHACSAFEGSIVRASSFFYLFQERSSSCPFRFFALSFNLLHSTTNDMVFRVYFGPGPLPESFCPPLLPCYVLVFRLCCWGVYWRSTSASRFLLSARMLSWSNSTSEWCFLFRVSRLPSSSRISMLTSSTSVSIRC